MIHSRGTGARILVPFVILLYTEAIFTNEFTDKNDAPGKETFSADHEVAGTDFRQYSVFDENADNEAFSGFDDSDDVDEEDAFTVLDEPEEDVTLTDQIYDWLDVIATALIAVVLIFSMVFRVATIEGSSMEETLFSNEKVVISNVGYTPKRGDVVVIYRETGEPPIIKRVIAVAGEKVDIVDGYVYVNDERIDEPYLTQMTAKREPGTKFPLTVESGKVFVLGDNRLVSNDSRSLDIGLVDEKNILGHAFIRIFPFNKFGGIKK